MATSEKSKSADEMPADLLPVIRKAGVLSEKIFDEIKTKVRDGAYPFDPLELAERLVHDQVLTEYQARRFLANKPHGLTVGRYVIQDRLGSGSMGRVYKATHKLMGRTVALKIIAPEIITNARVVARFQREMKLVGRLDHPNVVRAFDADQLGSMLYIVMEYVPGQSLGQIYRTKGPLPVADVIEFASQASLGLAHAHGQGIVHRDIKPSNLFLTFDRQVKVLDLGLGVLMEADQQATFATADGIAVGTIDYMSPEQACGREVDGRSDLYSLGCAMFHMMTGKLPFSGDSPIERLGKRISGQPTPIQELLPSLPKSVIQAMGKLLATDPKDRFQTAEDASAGLREILPRKQNAAGAGAKGPVREFRGDKPQAPEVKVVEKIVEKTVEKIVKVKPNYPRWFAPLARLAERSGAWALLAIAGMWLLGVALGFAISYLVR